MAIELCGFDCGFPATGQCVACRRLICHRDSWPGQWDSGPGQWDLCGLEDETRPWRMAELDERAQQLWERGNHCIHCVRAALEEVPAQHDAIETLPEDELLDLIHTGAFRAAYTSAGVAFAAQRIQDRLFDDPGFVEVMVAAIRAQNGGQPVWWRTPVHRTDQHEEWLTWVVSPGGDLIRHHTVVTPARKGWFRTRPPVRETTSAAVPWSQDQRDLLWQEHFYAWHPQERSDWASRPAEPPDLCEPHAPAGGLAQGDMPLSPAVGIGLGRSVVPESQLVQALPPSHGLRTIMDQSK